jgi:lipopolysaccharide transport system permease protein
MTIIVFVLMIIYYNLDISLMRFAGLLSLSILIATGASFGIGLIIASTTIKYRDFRYVLPFFLQALFFTSPVVYPLSLYNSERLQFVLSLNPLAGSILLVRSALNNNAVEWNLIIYSSLVTLFLIIAGLTLFRRIESQYSDLL